MFRVKNFEKPPHLKTEDGRPRRVGLEIELAGLDVARAARTLSARLGGRVEGDSRFVRHVRGTELGDLRVELDAAALKSSQLQDRLRKIDGARPGAHLKDTVERALSSLARTVVPCEIVTGPLELSQLEAFDEALDALRAAGAEGTNAGALNAFGLHFNPDLPSERPERLFAHLRAFVLLYPRLVADGEVDWSRRVTPFIDPYPDSYVEHLLTRPAPTDLDALVSEYLDFNPTRNRALDMLCAFRALRPGLVDSRLDDPRIQARKTFHYRLANSRVDEAGWTIAEEWNRWVEVERLADDEARLADTVDAWSTAQAVLGRTSPPRPTLARTGPRHRNPPFDVGGESSPREVRPDAP